MESADSAAATSAKSSPSRTRSARGGSPFPGSQGIGGGRPKRDADHVHPGAGRPHEFVHALVIGLPDLILRNADLGVRHRQGRVDPHETDTGPLVGVPIEAPCFFLGYVDAALDERLELRARQNGAVVTFDLQQLHLVGRRVREETAVLVDVELPVRLESGVAQHFLRRLREERLPDLCVRHADAEAVQLCLDQRCADQTLPGLFGHDADVFVRHATIGRTAHRELVLEEDIPLVVADVLSPDLPHDRIDLPAEVPPLHRVDSVEHQPAHEGRGHDAHHQACAAAHLPHEHETPNPPCRLESGRPNAAAPGPETRAIVRDDAGSVIGRKRTPTPPSGQRKAAAPQHSGDVR